MAHALSDADLVICRAGAMTVAEVAAVGVAALFVPLPHAIDDHQTANARYLSECQGAWLQKQAGLTVEWLADWLHKARRPPRDAGATQSHGHGCLKAPSQTAELCEQAVRSAAGGTAYKQ